MKKRTKELMVYILAIAVLFFMATNVLATDLNELLENEENLTNNTNVDTNTNADFEDLNDTNIENNNTENTNLDKDGNEELPDTGLDNSVMIIIAICGISAVYAYKKIKDYNIK